MPEDGPDFPVGKEFFDGEGYKLMASVFVPGTPVPQGSMKAFVVGKRAFITHSKGRELTDWRLRIVTLFQQSNATLTRDAYYLILVFRFLRPKTVKRQYLTVRPDLDKLVRSVLDALTGVLWYDDSQVCAILARKEYVDGNPGTEISVYHRQEAGIKRKANKVQQDQGK